jgi:hypothetical protein
MRFDANDVGGTRLAAPWCDLWKVSCSSLLFQAAIGRQQNEKL